MPSSDALAGYGRLGINVNWLLEDNHPGPMLFEGDHRDAHSDLVGAFAGDAQASARVEERTERGLKTFRDAQTSLYGYARELGHNPGDEVVKALAVLMLKGELTEGSARFILEILRLQAVMDSDRAMEEGE